MLYWRKQIVWITNSTHIPSTCIVRVLEEKFKYMFIKIKKSINNFFKTSLEQSLEEEFNFILNNRKKAENNLLKLGWIILSTDERIAFYSYKIQKNDYIFRVSLREALNMR